MRGEIIEKIKYILLALAILVIATGFALLLRRAAFPDTSIAMVYLLAVLMIAWLTHSFALGFLTSLFATFLFNYFIVEPRNTFAINNTSYIITFITMSATALVTSALTLLARQNAKTAQIKESETKALYDLTNRLTDAKDIREITETAVSVISRFFSCKAVCLCDQENESTDAADGFNDWPIHGRENIVGIVRLPAETAHALTESQLRILHAMIESIALAMDRYYAAAQRLKTRDEILIERYRANLLRAVSHDLRTPLASIIGASEMLLDMTNESDHRHALMKNIHNDAGWLHAMVENILSLTRLQDGKLALQKHPEAAEEIIGGAVGHLAKRSPEYEIKVDMPDELLLIPMDGRLIEQVLINLLNNAIHHCEPEKEIKIMVTRADDGKTARFIVRDEGNGIPENDLPNIFNLFYTSPSRHADAGKGIGLGLTICETIIKAHGGSIQARNRSDGRGAEFCFTLPL